MHDDLLQRDHPTSFLGSRAVNLTIGEIKVRGVPGGGSGSGSGSGSGRGLGILPKGTLSKLAEDLIVGDSGASDEAGFWSLVSYGEGSRRRGDAAVSQFAAAHGRLYRVVVVLRQGW